MTKKFIIAASIAGVLALGGGAFVIGNLLGTQASAGEDSKAAKGLLTEIKLGKYYLEGGTENEYIEVYDDGTLQIFGLDYLQMVIDLNSEYVAGLTEDEYQTFVDSEQDLVDFWNGRHYYFCNEYVKLIGIQDEPPEPGQLGSKSGFSLEYTDENTLIWDDEHIYKYAE
ncbi:MAG: hypothetical protein ACI4JS_00345 [Oscillospiraceae bacterium]